MVQVGYAGSRQCLACGQEFHPIRLSLAEVERMAERAAAAAYTDSFEVKYHLENRADQKLWVPKDYK